MRSYRLLTGLGAPLIFLWLQLRRLRGKEEAKRLRERFGYATKPRPDGMLLWIHAASVGEANSVLLLITMLRQRFAHLHILLTTGTVTSAKLMAARLPKDVLHQYAPVDTPQATLRFIRHWKPDLAFWVESELWPNLVQAADYYQCFMAMLNGRMSERSFAAWRRYPAMIKDMLARFNIIFAQSQDDAQRLMQLGAKEALYLGNLKYDASLLPCNEAELVQIKTAIGTRPVWLAASTHPGEEALVLEAHRLLSVTRPHLLLILVPRHAHRGDALAAEMKKHWRVAQRSRKEAMTPQTQIYLADTMGELGLFYRLSEIAFLGGSLVRHGGQNPLEAVRLASAVITGPHTYNFADMYREMGKRSGCVCVENAAQLAARIELLLGNRTALEAQTAIAKQWVDANSGAALRIIDMLEPVFAPRKKRTA